MSCFKASEPYHTHGIVPHMKYSFSTAYFRFSSFLNFSTPSFVKRMQSDNETPFNFGRFSLGRRSILFNSGRFVLNRRNTLLWMGLISPTMVRQRIIYVCLYSLAFVESRNQRGSYCNITKTAFNDRMYFLRRMWELTRCMYLFASVWL